MVLAIVLGMVWCPSRDSVAVHPCTRHGYHGTRSARASALARLAMRRMGFVREGGEWVQMRTAAVGTPCIKVAQCTRLAPHKQPQPSHTPQ